MKTASCCAVLAGLLLAPTAHALSHDLGFDSDPLARQIVVGSKTFNDGRRPAVTDSVFRDGLGREAYFHGFAVSGETKLAEAGFKPFFNSSDAALSFGLMGQETGANMTRFMVSWEGVNPDVDIIDTAYLDQVVQQLRAAIGQHIYVFVDFHADLYSRYLWNANSWYTGNGAPQYVIAGNTYPQEYCGPVCVAWSQNLFTNEAVRLAARNFWDNVEFQTKLGPRHVRDTFIWQMGQALRYIKSQLTPEEFAYVLGVEPMNEPYDGGMEGLSPATWDVQKLWPVYTAARAEADAAGWGDKLVFAEPLVFWNTAAGIVAPATGGHHLPHPGPRYVFTPHWYDAGRQGVDTRAVDNGAYLPHFDLIRDEGRWWNSPTVMSEFGMWLNKQGSWDTNRTIKAMYQGLETSDNMHLAKDRFVDPYAPLVSGTQWHWDIYANRHHEIMNGNLSKVQTAGDGWNGENFSVVSYQNGALQWNLDSRNLQRAYPRRAQGDILNFLYNDLSRDAGGTVLDWASVRPIVGDKEYLRANQFALLSWRGRNAEAPTEIFLPNHFDPLNTVVITEKQIVNGLSVATAPANQANEVLLLNDVARSNSALAGHRLLIWDDADTGEDANSWHYALVFKKNPGEDWNAAKLAQLQVELNQTSSRHQTALYLTGTMTSGSYAGYTNPDYATDYAPKPFTLAGNSWWFISQFSSFWWSGGYGDVTVFLNGQAVDSGKGASDQRNAWIVNGPTRYQICEKNGRRCSNSYQP